MAQRFARRQSFCRWRSGFDCLSTLMMIFLAAQILSGVMNISFAKEGEAEALMDQIQKKYSTLSTLQAEFTQKFTQGKVQRVESGVLLLSRGAKMRWDYRQPEPKLFLVDGKRQYTWIPSENRVYRERLKVSEDRRTPILLLLGRLHWRKVFSQVALEESGNRGTLLLRARPKDDSQGDREVVLEVEKNTLHLIRITIDNMDRSRMEFVFFGVVENPRVDPQKFVFRAPPGVEMVDQEEGR